MTSVGRLVKMTASEGNGEELAQLLLAVSAELAGTAGCELYVINRVAGEPDVVWVNELWLSQEALDASLEAFRTAAGEQRIAQVTGLLARPPERVDLEPLGGVGYLPGGSGATIVNLEDVEDQAPRFGLSHVGEARFAGGALDAARTGVSHHRLRAGARQAFGHRHHHAEEVYVVLAGGGRVRIDGDVHEIRARDAIRVAPESMRAFEAGPEGLELVAVGPHHPGDAEMDRDFWKE